MATANSKVLISWRLPGGEWVDGLPSAREVVAVGATVRLTSDDGLHAFEVTHKDNWGDERFPWRVGYVNVVGSERPAEGTIIVDEFPSFSVAVHDCRRRIRERDYTEAK